jgi:hypothetical protein
MVTGPGLSASCLGEEREPGTHKPPGCFVNRSPNVTPNGPVVQPQIPGDQRGINQEYGHIRHDGSLATLAAAA